ncbi:hypothetical protein [uncultured Gammaproteobacteria bacterium]|nr:hypothetical protein [uncultured Gammaproteobacteria bacterium]CAC9436184.1 hypothetical protein [uncultured Gammaproteobacteria bacterium]
MCFTTFCKLIFYQKYSEMVKCFATKGIAGFKKKLIFCKF